MDGLDGYSPAGTLQRPWHGKWRIYSDAIIDDYIDAIATAALKQQGILTYLFDKDARHDARASARASIKSILDANDAKVIPDGEADILYLPQDDLELRLHKLRVQIDHLLQSSGSEDRFDITRTAFGN